MACFGGSFGGVLAKRICVAPGKVEKAVLVVPVYFLRKRSWQEQDEFL